MRLSEDHLAVRDAVRDFVVAEVTPHAAAWDREATFPKAALRGLAALGCYGVAVPTEWDGAGLDYLALAVILEEVAGGDMLGAFCLTEPHVGSQADGLKTTARRVSDTRGDHYVIDGVKQFITSGKNGDLAIVMAVTDTAA